MADFYAIPTNIGEAKLANALALGEPLVITQLAVGDGQGSGAQGTPLPDPEQEALVSERRRAAINTLTTDAQNANVLIAEQVIPEDVGGWWIREMGLFDEDDDLIAICNTPPTYKPVLASGSGRTQVVRMQIIVSNVSAVTLKVDPAVVLATRQHVLDVMAAHEQSRNHPAATESAQGMVELATPAEGQGLTDPARAITPAVLGAVLGSSYRLRNIHVMEASGTYEKPAWLRAAVVEAQAGGGGGGGAAGGSGSAEGSGGGGGGFARSFVTADQLNASEVVTVGGGGGGGGAGNTGGGGGASSLGAHATANGGSGGSGGTNTGGSNFGGGGTGGGASGNLLSVEGSRGGSRRVISGQSVFANHGGGSYYGGSNAVGTGSKYGGGGSGANATSTGEVGHDGADGVVIVYEYE